MSKKLIAGSLGVLMVFLYSCNAKDMHAEKHSLRINLKEEPTSLDPRRGRNMSGSSQLHAMLFEGLMRLEPNGKLSCAQASSYEVSQDKKTYTFHLSKVFWSDGTPVTAYDFEKTWKDILDPQFPSLDAHALYCIKNANAAKKGEVPLESVGIHSKDAKTLVVELDHPTPHFLQITATSVLFPVNQTQAKHFPTWYLEAGEHFLCNGPFKLTAWSHNNHMVLEKNGRYRLADQVKLDAVYITMIDNETATLHMYNSGNLDMVGLPISPLPFDSYQDLMQQDLLHLFEAPGTMVCTFNTKQFPFYSVNMRKAFSYAINRQLLVEHITQLKELPALSVVPPLLKKEAKAYFEDGNMDLAREYFQKGLDELGIQASDLEGKLKFSYWIHDHACPMLPQALQQQWLQELGVEVELEALEFKTLHDKGKAGNFSMGYFVYLSMYHDPIELLDRFKYAQNVRNYPRWQNDTYVELMNKADRTTSEKEHFELLDQAEAIIMEEMPFAPVFHWNYALLIQPYVKGFAISPLGFLCFDRVYIEGK
jgi:oligopeptide transport system substrate-binding protein